MNNYELLFILPGTLSEDEVKPIVQSVKDVITANGGQELVVDDMGKSRLAYPMKHIRYGYFQLAHFNTEAKDVTVIENKLKLLNQLLRVLIQKYDPKKQVQKITFSDQQREGSEERVEMPVVEQPVVHATKKTETKKKVSLDEIDKKLDQILEIDISNV